MIRSILSVVAGYLTMAILTMAFFGLLQVVTPTSFPADGSMPPGGIVAIIIIFAFGFALVGGVVTRFIARGNVNPMFALYGVIIILGLASMALNPAPQPTWYQLSLIVAGVIGAIVGGRLSANRRPASVPFPK